MRLSICLWNDTLYHFILLIFVKKIEDKIIFFFFSSRRRHTRSYGDWSSDVCLFRSRVDDPADQPWHRAGGSDARDADRATRVSTRGASGARGGGRAASERAGWGRVWEYRGV